MAQRSTHDSAPPRLPEKPPQTNLPSTPIALITQTPKIGKTHPHSRCPFTVPGTLKRRAPANRGHTTNRVGDTPHAPFPPPTSIQKCLLLETPQKPSEKTSDLSSSPKPRKSAKPTANHGARRQLRCQALHVSREPASWGHTTKAAAFEGGWHSLSSTRSDDARACGFTSPQDPSKPSIRKHRYQAKIRRIPHST